MQPLSEQALLEAVRQLVAIESTADNPAGLRAAYEYMREMVLDRLPDITIEEFESNGKPSFLAYRGGQRPDRFHVILNAHVDVVPGKPEQFDMTVENGKLFGRGVYDMKAAAVVLAQVFCENVDRVQYPLGFQVVTDEEPGGHDGTLYQVIQGVRSDFTICGECGRRPGTYEIANEHKGIVFADVVLNGKSSHGAYPWNGDNAALRATQFVQALHEVYPNPVTESQDTTVTVTAISSATGVHNKVPEHAVVKIDCRFTNDDPNFQNKSTFVDFIERVYPSAKVTSVHIFSDPMYSDPHYAPLQELKLAAEQVEGHAFSYVRRHAGSDGRHFRPSGGQACEFGIAGEDQHGDNEHITIKAFQDYIKSMRAFLDRTLTPESVLDREVAGVS